MPRNGAGNTAKGRVLNSSNSQRAVKSHVQGKIEEVILPNEIVDLQQETEAEMDGIRMRVDADEERQFEEEEMEKDSGDKEASSMDGDKSNHEHSWQEEEFDEVPDSESEVQFSRKSVPQITSEDEAAQFLVKNPHLNNLFR